MVPHVFPSAGPWKSSRSCDGFQDDLAPTSQQTGNQAPASGPADEIKAARAADRFFNLGSGSRFSSWDGLSSQERPLFVKMVAELARQGLIGFEVVEIDGRPHKSFITTQIGDPLTSHAPLYDRSGRYRWP